MGSRLYTTLRTTVRVPRTAKPGDLIKVEREIPSASAWYHTGYEHGKQFEKNFSPYTLIASCYRTHYDRFQLAIIGTLGAGIGGLLVIILTAIF